MARTTRFRVIAFFNATELVW